MSDSVKRLNPELGQPSIQVFAIENKHENDKAEKAIQEEIANYLRIRSVWFARSRMDKRSTTTLGQPDFLCAMEGVPIALEVKVPGRGPTPAQSKCHEAMRQNKWRVYVVHSIQEVKAVLDAFFPTKAMHA